MIDRTYLPTAGEQRVLLQNLSWQMFKNLLDELGEHRSSRLAYNQGYLEIIAPASSHEKSNRMIEGLIVVLLVRAKPSRFPKP